MTRPNSTTQSIVTPPYPRPMNRNMRLARHQPEVEPPVRRQRLLYIPGMLSQIRLAVTDLEAEACRRGEWSSLNYNQATAAALHITRDMLRFIVLPGESLFEQTLERRPQNQLAISLKRPNVTDSDWHVRPWKHYGILVRPVRSLTGIHLDSSYFAPSDDLLVAIVLMLDGAPPTIFLIPSTKWLEIPESRLLYHGQYHCSDRRRWSIRVSTETLGILSHYKIADVLWRLRRQVR